MHSDPNVDQLAFDVDGVPTPNESSIPSAPTVTEPSTPPSSSASALDTLLNEYRARATSEREKGTLFEELTRQFLLHDARFAHQFKEVYLWGEWPERRTGDTGIDLVAIPNQQDAGPVAIQCKFYASPMQRHLASEIVGRWDEVIFGVNVTQSYGETALISLAVNLRRLDSSINKGNCAEGLGRLLYNTFLELSGGESASLPVEDQAVQFIEQAGQPYFDSKTNRIRLGERANAAAARRKVPDDVQDEELAYVTLLLQAYCDQQYKDGNQVIAVADIPIRVEPSATSRCGNF